jgi:hypothetical protein
MEKKKWKSHEQLSKDVSFCLKVTYNELFERGECSMVINDPNFITTMYVVYCHIYM